MICRQLPYVLSLTTLLAIPAIAQTNTSHPLVGCRGADPSYLRTSNETGGIPLFLQRSEAAKAFHLVRETSRNNMGMVLWASAPLEGTPQTFKIPVDSVTQRITFAFSVNAAGGKITLKDPAGKVIDEKSPRTENTDLSCGRIVTVTSPEAGTWHAEVTGSGTYWLQVQAQSDLYFTHAKFVKLAGRPGHEGMFPIDGQPLAGQPAHLEIHFSGAAAGATEFVFVDERSQPVQKLRLKIVSQDEDSAEFEGPVNLPSGHFRLAAIGHDANGKAFQRVEGPAFHAETVEVTSRIDDNEIKAGTERQAIFLVRNLGPERNFHVTITDPHKYIAQAQPTEFNLHSGESAAVHVTLRVPADAMSGEDSVVAVATSTSGAPTSNSSILSLFVSSQKPSQ